jgi:hypothetical protein
MLGAILGQAHAGERTLFARLGASSPGSVRRPDDLLRQESPGHALITAILAAGGHVVARVKGGISLPLALGGGWLLDGSRLTWLNAPSGKKRPAPGVRTRFGLAGMGKKSPRPGP